MSKSAEAFRTIGEVADELDVPKHVLRFWEGKFPHIRPMKRGGGRRYYRPEDLELLRGIRHLLHAEGYTIKGVQKILREQGIDQVKAAAAAGAALAAKDGRAAKVRGRKTLAKPQLTASAKSGAATAKAPASGARTNSAADKVAEPAPAATLKDIIAAAISELEICRQLLVANGAKMSEQVPPRLRAARS